MMSRDLIVDYEVVFVVYFVAYAVFLISFECIVLKRIVSPINDLIVKIKKPMQKRNKNSEQAGKHSSGGIISGTPHSFND